MRMTADTEFLAPENKLVDETVDWLCGCARFASKVEKTAEGANSLAHVLVVVPTAQSARNLRLALAKRAAKDGLGAILPPKISMPGALLEPAGRRVASEAEELAVMAEVLIECDIARYKSLFPKPPADRTADWALDMAGVLLGIESILAEAALLMSDVKTQQDVERWRDLAEIERLFISRLDEKGAMPRCTARREAVAAGCIDEGVSHIVLPSFVDIQEAFVRYLENSSRKVTFLIHAHKEDSAKFDRCGRPKEVFAADIGPEMIDSLPNAVIEADEAAKFFRAVRHDEALPALVVCDAEMYPEVEGSFRNYFTEDELVLRNPSREMLLRSSLGRLFGAIVHLEASSDYETFSTLVRTGDIARWASSLFNCPAGEIARFVGALDSVQNAHLPQTIDDVIAGAAADAKSAWRAQERSAADGLKRLAEAIKAEIGDPIAFLRKIFACVTLDEKNPADRELIAAAKKVREIREASSSDLVPAFLRRKLFSRLLKTASYMLEPTAANIMVTSGWLEVPWCLEDEIVIVGFNEGCVPENVVGHPFVPDSLRKELKITTNASREARDSFILARAVSCRAKGAVSVSLHQISGDKNVMKPSRLLFNGISDEDLPELALRLYAVTKGNEGAPVKELPPAWRLKLPIPPQETVFRERMSPTALDQYLRCPFNFYMQEVFGRVCDDRNQEIDNMAFGNLCHSALDAFAKEGPKDSSNPDEIASFLVKEVHRQLESFGENPPAIVELQGAAAAERLKAFAEHQAARRRAGWRIVCSERNFECRIKGCPTLLRGKVDRIDRHDATGDIAIIDYKTWNRAKEDNYNSVQLPVYRAMVEASGLFDPQKARASKAFYCILAEHPEDTMFDEAHACHEGGQSEAEDMIVGLLTDIARGIFYPPGKQSGGKSPWQDSYGHIIWRSIEEGVDPAWLDDQKKRKGDES